MTIIQWSRANAKITRATILAVNIPALHNVWKIMPPQVITFLSARIILKAELYAAATKHIKQMVKLNINKWGRLHFGCSYLFPIPMTLVKLWPILRSIMLDRLSNGFWQSERINETPVGEPTPQKNQRDATYKHHSVAGKISADLFRHRFSWPQGRG